MKNKRFVLLKALLLSTSNRNILKYSEDRKKKSATRGAIIGKSILYLMLLAYCILMAIGYGSEGLTYAIPEMTVVIISIMAFFFTLLKTNGYLFAFKEYDMLMAMPFNARDILEEKFLYMYVKSFPIMGIISLSMFVGYTIFADFKVFGLIFWVLLTFVLPLIPMVIASLLGSLIAGIGSKFKYKRIVTLVLTFAIIIFSFCSRFIFDKLFRDNKIDEIISKTANLNGNIIKYYVPGKWFSKACNEGNVLYFLLFLAVSIAVLEVFVVLVGKKYRSINSRLMSHASHKKAKVKGMKQRSQVRTVAFKEFKRLLGSNIYLTNAAVGQIMIVILGIVVLFVDPNKAISAVMQDAPITPQMLQPAIPFVVYFLIGMVSTTCCSLSLEGKNLWIPLSMPIKPMTLLKGKMLFQMFFSIPFAVFGTICLSISFKTGLLDTLLFLLETVILCTFSTAFGMRCGVKHRKYDYENEVEVIKQGSAIAFYLIPNMISSMVLIALSVAAGLIMPSWAISVAMSVVATVLSLLSYNAVKKFAQKGLA